MNMSFPDIIQKELSQVILNRHELILAKPNSDQTIHKTLRYFLLIPQIFGYIPVDGILKNSVKDLHFSWTSWKTIYAIATISGASFQGFIKFYSLWESDVNIGHINKLCFDINGVLWGYFFLELARNWPEIMREWSMTEVKMISYGWPSGLEKKIYRTVIIFLTMAAIEYCLSESTNLKAAIECTDNNYDTIVYFLSTINKSTALSLFNFDLSVGLLNKIVNLQLTFNWTYGDLFIMVISMSVAARLRQVVNRIKLTVETKNTKESIWKQLREDYNRVDKLLKLINNHLANLILLSFSTNLFFILIQLFYSLKEMDRNLDRIYFYFSFALLISRTVCVCLFGSLVHEESQRPLLYLNKMPTEAYNVEVQRLSHQVSFYRMAISGKKFFYITKGLILTIAGAIVTYELVLIQFNANALGNESLSDKCIKLHE